MVRLGQAVNLGFRYEVALLVDEAHRQFAGAEIGRVGFQRHFDDLVLDVVTDAVPHAARRRWPILYRFRPAPKITVIPTVERPAGDAELVQRAFGGQVRLLDDPDDPELFRTEERRVGKRGFSTC